MLPYPVADNLVLCTFDRAPFSRGPVLDYHAISGNAASLVGEYDVGTPSVCALTGTLSGGNQQKAIVAREFSRPIRLLIANQLTRGLDVGSIEYIHARIVEKRDAGCAVLLISAKLDKILALSDRIAVIYRGKSAAVLDSASAKREVLGHQMAGIAPASSTPAI